MSAAPTKEVRFQLNNDLFLDSAEEDDLQVLSVNGPSSASQNPSSPICITIDDDEDGDMDKNSGEDSFSSRAPLASTSNSSCVKTKQVQFKDELSTHVPSKKETSRKKVTFTREVELESELKKMKVELDVWKGGYIGMDEFAEELLKAVTDKNKTNEIMYHKLNRVKKENVDLKAILAALQESEKQQTETLEEQREDIRLLKIELDNKTRELEEQRKVPETTEEDTRTKVSNAIEIYGNKSTIDVDQIEGETTQASLGWKECRNQSVTLCETREKLATSEKLVEKLQSEVSMWNIKYEECKKENQHLQLKVTNLKELKNSFVENFKTMSQLNDRFLSKLNIKDDEDEVGDAGTLEVNVNAHNKVDVNRSIEEEAVAVVDDDDDVIFIEEIPSVQMVTRSKAVTRQNPLVKPVPKVTKPGVCKVKRGSQSHAVDLDPNAILECRCICGKEFSCGKTLVDHVQLSGCRGNLTRCSKCPKSYINLARLRTHEKIAHKMHQN